MRKIFRQKNKYNNQKIIIDSFKFDSKKEGKYYQELKLLKLAGEVKDFQMQSKYVLIPSQRVDGKVIERPCIYKADFVVEYSNGKTEVVDVKGMRLPDYIIKRKLILWIHGIEIKEV